MSLTSNITTVLIVGAGPTGLTLACELARRDMPFRLIEASAGPQPGSRGKGIQPRTLEVLHDLGIAERVIANGRFAMPIRSQAPDGSIRESEAVAFRDRPDIPYPASLITPEWRIEEALRRLLAELGGSVELATTLETFDQNEESVTAVVRHDGHAETITADWLVGCDGGHSIVRKRAGITFDGETLDSVRMLVADVPITGLDRGVWHMWQHATGMVTLCPLPSTDLFQFQASVAPGQDPELSVANLQAILDDRSGQNDIRIGEPEWRSLWRANIRLVDRYRSGRVFVAGDAAHIHSPAGGQGMNTGIQDAHNLGWKMALVEEGADPALLDTYESERRPVAEGVLALSNERLRQTIEGRGIATRGSADTMQLSVGYRGSTLARDDRGDDAVLRAGDRAPDATGLDTADGRVRLFDLMRGGRFTLLRFGDGVETSIPKGVRILDVVPHVTGPGQVADTAGYLARDYEAGDRTLVLVRPDGVIGLISDAGDDSAVTAYLAALG